MEFLLALRDFLEADLRVQSGDWNGFFGVIVECLIVAAAALLVPKGFCKSKRVGAPDGTPRWTWGILPNPAAPVIGKVIQAVLCLRLLLTALLTALDFYKLCLYDPRRTSGWVVPLIAYLVISGMVVVFCWMCTAKNFDGFLGSIPQTVLAMAAMALVALVMGFVMDNNSNDKYLIPHIVYPVVYVILIAWYTWKNVWQEVSGLKEQTRKYHALAPKYEHYVQRALTEQEKVILGAAERFAEQAGQQGALQPRLALAEAPMLSMTNEDYLEHLQQANRAAAPADRRYDFSFMAGAYENCAQEFAWEKALPPLYGALGITREIAVQSYVSLCRSVEIYGAALGQALQRETQVMQEQLEKDTQIIARGIRGENVAFAAADEICRRDPSVRVLKNYRFKTETGSCECDLVLISAAGVVCIEVKNYGEDGAYGLYIASDGTWYKDYESQRHPIEGNPFSQNAAHMTGLRGAFGEELAAVGARVLPLVMVPNNIYIENDSSYDVIHVEALLAWLSRQPEELSAEQIDALWKQMSAKALPALAFPQVDYLGWQKHLRECGEELDALWNLAPQLRLSEKYRRL